MKEIERKFLVSISIEQSLYDCEAFDIRQGYLQKTKDCTVRVRTKNDKGYLTIKGPSQNFTRDEFEYEIPFSEAVELFSLCGDNYLEKTRYMVPFEGKMWEVDRFSGKLAGFYLAEIELESENEFFSRPDWLGEEVSLDPRFNNSALVSVNNIEELKIS